MKGLIKNKKRAKQKTISQLKKDFIKLWKNTENVEPPNLTMGQLKDY